MYTSISTLEITVMPLKKKLGANFKEKKKLFRLLQCKDQWDTDIHKLK